MEVLLVRISVLVMVLTSSYASEKLPDQCEDETVKAIRELVEVQQKKGDILKELVETQRQKDEVVALIQSLWSADKLQNLEESQNNLSLAQNKLVDRLDVIEAKGVDKLQNLEESQNNLSLALNKRVDRLDVIEAKSVDKLQNMDESQNKLSLALNKIVDRLDVIEAKITAESDHMNDRLDVISKNYEEVLQRLEDIEKLKSQIPEVPIVECKTPFEIVGEDCVHWTDEGMTWEDSQSYCKSLGASLIVPTIKEGFELAYGDRPMSSPHPPLFDFLFKKKSSSFYGWIGASVDKDNNAKWTNGEKLKRGDNRLGGNDHGRCIAAYVTANNRFATWTAECSTTFPTPVCQKKYTKSF
ncbi:uncharacterized protein LOC143028424 isoform X1 [Oratosquilla oratoria]|uniref:uncharacterized protein LOC143028424 isoform X1 n=1 Tax=Oratosquilla oratoria TaxID=337810 RepID=UPI003F771422